MQKLIINIKEKYITNNPDQTQRLGEKQAKKIRQLADKRAAKKTAVVLGLQGDLGSGKTTFLQGLAKGLGIKEKILSPTFIIFRKFQIPNPNDQSNPKSQIPKFKYFYHFDCYRIKNSKEILELGFKEIISNKKNIVAIEWPDKIKNILPKSAIIIKFKFISEKTRELTTGKFDKVF
ncbi:MAG: tRNA (adenosine(37)-N6)-threonylcarbamoyltransferase complex ATPase subunit type 1 TsaE [Patescibacteria group bacterium]|mgnify:CR=1 FL=1